MKIINIARSTDPEQFLDEVKVFFGYEIHNELFETHDRECGLGDFLKPNPVRTLELLNILYNIVPSVDYDDFLDYLTNKRKEKE